jgi:GNAT superfamily N-acetyltransferase
MTTALTIRPATAEDLDALLPLIAEYQRFYGARPDAASNRAFFARFLAPSDAGVLLGAWEASEPTGFTCLYWTSSSVSAVDVALMNDLLVSPTHRSRGVGEQLIAAAADAARSRGCVRLEWRTAPDNARAQRLYDRLDATRSEWLQYSIRL